jgi:hypothetical protein
MTKEQLVVNTAWALSALCVLALLFAEPRDITEMRMDDQSTLFQPGKAFEKNIFARFVNFMM